MLPWLLPFSLSSTGRNVIQAIQNILDYLLSLILYINMSHGRFNSIFQKCYIVLDDLKYETPTFVNGLYFFLLPSGNTLAREPHCV